MRSKYDSVKYKKRPNFRVNLSFHGTTPPYTILSEICTGLFRGYVIAKSSAVNSQSSSTLREKSKWKNRNSGVTRVVGLGGRVLRAPDITTQIFLGSDTVMNLYTIFEK